MKESERLGARWAWTVVFVLAGLGFVSLIIAVGLRLGYPYELEWIEGSSLVHIQRIRDGAPLFTAPSLDWTPSLYTPLYFYVSAFFGDGFAVARLVSALATLATATAIFLLVNRETGNYRVSILGGLFYLGSFQMVGMWFDVARVDALYVCLATVAIATFRIGRGSLSAVLTGVAICLAFWAKQTAAMTFAPVFLGMWFLDKKRAVVCAIAAGVTLGGSILYENIRSDGWFFFYTFVVPGGHPFEPSMWLGFWIGDMLSVLALACAFAIGYFVFTPDRSQRVFYAFVLVGFLGSSWFSRLHEGGWFNVLMPAYAALSVLFGIGIDAALRFIRSAVSLEYQGRLANVVLVLVAFQFLRVIYNPLATLPSAEDREAGDQIVALLRRAPGEVLVLDHPYLAELAGKKRAAHGCAITDILRHGDERADELREQLRAEIIRRRYEAIYLDDHRFMELLGDEYRQQPDGTDPSAFLPVVGSPLRPRYLMVRESDR